MEIKVGDTYYDAFYDDEKMDVHIEQIVVKELDLINERIVYQSSEYNNESARSWNHHIPLSAFKNYYKTIGEAISAALECVQKIVNDLKFKYRKDLKDVSSNQN